MSFIAANERPYFIKLFKWYAWLLFRRRFENVYLKQKYSPSIQSKTIYFANHNSWWDGLIPLLLNEFVLHQRARAIMEDKQMHRYPFFKWLGAFSIDREDSRNTIYSLRYALNSMQRSGAALYIFPEGKLRPPHKSFKPDFEGGLAWLYTKLPEVDFVPLSIFTHSYETDKNSLIIHIGKTVKINPESSHQAINSRLEAISGRNLYALANTEPNEFQGYTPLW